MCQRVRHRQTERPTALAKTRTGCTTGDERMTRPTMTADEDAALQQASDPAPTERRRDFWGIVLAGGEGVRLRPLVRRALGDDRPKQYVPLFGARSLLGQTLDRIGLAIPGDQTIVVTMGQHAAYTDEEFAGRRAPRVLAQPADRGTATAILYPVWQVAAQDPEAIVAVFPSDHFIAPELLFMAYVAEVGVWVDQHPDRLVLLGAQPTTPEVEY